MEGEVAPPIFLRQGLPTHFLARKRDFPWQGQSPNLAPPSQPSEWESANWAWDSAAFIAQPAPEEPPSKNKTKNEEERLTLKLGGQAYGMDESAARPSKRVRSGSPGNVASYPSCQVDDCKADLSNAKDYHRRHKVCEVHSKTTKAMVGKQMQRFCQQCSRFHLLAEFDEGKRSCRRRLAGHNRRRRKTQQADDASSRLLLPPTGQNPGGADLDIVNLLAILARLQGSSGEKDLLLQLLSRVSAIPALNPSSQSSKHGGFDLNVCQSAEDQGNSSADLITILSAALKAADGVASSKLAGDACLPSKDLSERRRSSDNAGPSLQLQLFSSTEEDSPSRRKYLSSGSSYPTEDRSHSSSPPVERSLFPLQSTTEEAPKPADGAAVRRLGRNAYLAGYSSSSGSDHSPSSSHSDGQDRTGRIIFKLFDKNPSDFPPSLRSEVLTWLSHSPSDIESYIRPGCVVLSIYLSMPSFAWEELHEEFLQRVTALVQRSESDLWRSGRFLVQTDRRLASHKDGRIRLSKSGRSWTTPELICVSPLAVVGGEETSLVLRGRNLGAPGTRVHCTLTSGGYLSKELASPARRGAEEICEEPTSVDAFVFPATLFSDHFGRCFVEVENGLNGSSFPLIVADKSVCRELCLLEPEIEADPRSREDALNFLHELGWLFQRRRRRPPLSLDFASSRFKFLLAFAIDRDLVAVAKKLLDDLAAAQGSNRASAEETLAMIAEIQLLHRAVKRRCRKMVDLLLHFSVDDQVNASRFFPFTPDAKGRGGLSPLHLAASIQGADDIVDSLTSDPLQGLTCWASSVDDNGETPCDYATMRGNHSYIKLVAGKMADIRNAQVSITIVKGADAAKSCAQCAAVAARMARTRSAWQPQALLRRPYVHSMLAIAAVCVCVCLFLRGAPELGSVAPFEWENLGVGTM
ncbi:squamosa promoter-binding-like protein 15 isoform X2 [Wolffia australiana]